MVTAGFRRGGMTSLTGNMRRQYSGPFLTRRGAPVTLGSMRSWRMRRWAHTVALVLLVASARLPHLGQDDQACASLVSDGSSQGRSALGAGSDAALQPEHCAICHWTRLLRSPLTVVGISTTNVGPAT